MNRVPNLVLIGFMGAGKSSVGTKCAQQLGFPYHDTDLWIVRRAHKSIPQIFEQDGEEAFRGMERDAIRTLTQRSAIVLSTGGGAVLDPENRRLLKESGFVVLLSASVECILSRVQRRSTRPLLQCEDPEARIREMLDQRREAYQVAAHATIDTTDLTREAVAEQVVSLYRRLAI